MFLRTKTTLVKVLVARIRKNVDLRLKKGCQSFFSLLGSDLAYKSLMSPVVKLHLYNTFTCPILRSGLGTFALRQNKIESLALFQRKIIKSILHVNDSAATPANYFLTGQLPIEAKIHCDVFSLFYNVWSNPDSKIHHIVKYLLSHNTANSRTWAQHVRNLCNMYVIEDPLSMLSRDPPSKSVFKNNVKSTITAFHENELRNKAKMNSSMKYLNPSVLGLNGRHHPAIGGITDTNDVRVMREHTSMLISNYLTYKMKSLKSGGSPFCPRCDNNNDDDIEHILTSHISTSSQLVLDKIAVLCSLSLPQIIFFDIRKSKQILAQFLLDPSSLNLRRRISSDDPILPDLFKLCQKYCHITHKDRMTNLQLINDNKH